MTKLHAQELGYHRNHKKLFSHLEFELNPGQGMLVYGPNGSGKTSLLKIIAGLIAPTKGAIEWKQSSINNSLSAYHQDLHFLGHHHGLQLHLSVTENIAYSQILAGHSYHAQRISMALDSVKLLSQSDALARQLSAGQKKRLALSRLLAAPKPLWLLDEPLTNLDQDGFQWFGELVEEHLHHQGLVIIASHQALPLKDESLFQKIYLNGTPHA